MTTQMRLGPCGLSPLQTSLLNSATVGSSVIGFGETLQIHSVMLQRRENKGPQVWGVVAQSSPGTIKVSKMLPNNELGF